MAFAPPPYPLKARTPIIDHAVSLVCCSGWAATFATMSSDPSIRRPTELWISSARSPGQVGVDAEDGSPCMTGSNMDNFFRFALLIRLCAHLPSDLSSPQPAASLCSPPSHHIPLTPHPAAAGLAPIASALAVELVAALVQVGGQCTLSPLSPILLVFPRVPNGKK